MNIFFQQDNFQDIIHGRFHNHYKKPAFFVMSKKTAVRIRFDMEVLLRDVT